ncbi:MAG: hypothetical protein IKG85_03985 [Clostridia bacterium]|nr:hypothetical protein [Clostridia bacterium]
MGLLNYGKHVVTEEFALLIVSHAGGRGVAAVLGKLIGGLNECVRQASGCGNARVNEGAQAQPDERQRILVRNDG